MEKFLKIDPHVHSNGISLCSRVTCEEIIDNKIALGYDGVVLTNHCQTWYYPAAEHSHYVERVIEEYRRGKRYADEKGFAFFLGLEVTLTKPYYGDWLLYGVTEECLRASPCLYQLTQEELFAFCERWGIVLIEAHPFREGCTVGDPAYMHGVEINCTNCDLDKISLVEEFAEKHNLLVTCGTDYHTVERKYFGGIYLPEGCQTAVDMAKHIRSTGEIKTFYGGGKKDYRKK